MRFLYFGDKHERPTTPESRLDDFRETQRAKTQEIIELGKKYGVTAFLEPGDFFDSPNPPLDFVAEVMGMWTGQNFHEVMAKVISGEWKEEAIVQVLKDYIPLIGVVGNHELYGNNIRTLNKTAIGFVHRMGLIRFATKENPCFFYTEDGLKIAITGTHYHLDIDHPEHIEEDYVVQEKLGDYHIHIVHGMLSDKSLGSHIRHTLIDQIKHTKADLTISGHDHIGFPLTEIDGKYFVNPGAVVRLSNSLKEMNRIPKVLLIDISKEHGMRLTEIPLKSAQKGEYVLSRAKITERKIKEERLEQFKKAVRDAGMKKATDIIEIIRDLADEKSIPSTVKEDLINRISEKKKEIQPVQQEVVEEAYIEKMVLENFQSHAYTELTFDKGFNIFVGESKQGKTAVLRAFSWVYENKPAGKRIIRTGADYARVTLYLSNGYVISRYMEARKGGKNGYEITDPKTGEVSFHNTKILPEVQRLLGFTPLIIDKDLQFDLNFMKQGDGWFLIGDQYSAPSKAKIIGGIYGVQYADAVFRELETEERKVNDRLKEVNGQLVKIEEDIRQYEYLKEVKKTIELCEIYWKEIELLQHRKEEILKVLQKQQELKRAIKESEQVIEQLKGLPLTNTILEETKKAQQMQERLQKCVSKYKEGKAKLNAIRDTLQRLQGLEQWKEDFLSLREMGKILWEIEKAWSNHRKIKEQLKQQQIIIQSTNHTEEMKKMFYQLQTMLIKQKEIKEKWEKVARAEQHYRKYKRGVEAIAETLQRTNSLPVIHRLYEEIKQWHQKKEKIQQLREQVRQVSHAMGEREKEIHTQSSKIHQLTLQYQHILQEVGQCPVCYGTIDQNTIHRIVSQLSPEGEMIACYHKKKN